MRKLLILGFVVAAACGKKGNSDPPPAMPASGAPIAFEAKSFKAGTSHNGMVDLKAYNFSDKKIGSYWLLFRYSDAAGNVLSVKKGTPFEKNYDFMTLSGNRFACEPKSWCSFKVDNLNVPDGTAKVEIAAKWVKALSGGKLEDKPLYESGTDGWPGEKPAEAHAEGSATVPAATPEDRAGEAAAQPGSAAGSN
jgi:hypothetical protein